MHRTRWLAWRLAFASLLLLLVVAIPLLMMQMLVVGWRGRASPRLLAAGFLLHLCLFHQLGRVFPLVTHRGGLLSLFAMEQAVGRVGIVGVTLMALLSGYGSVATPAAHLFYFIRPVSAAALATASLRHQQATDTLTRKKAHFQTVCERSISGRHEPGGPVRWAIQRVSAAFSLTPEAGLAEDIANLELAVDGLHSDYRDLCHDHVRVIMMAS